MKKFKESIRNEMFYSKKNHKDSTSTEVIRIAINGRYGVYSKGTYGGNISEKRMLEDGYRLVYIDDEEIKKIHKLENKRKNRIQKNYYNSKIQERFEQIAICLKSAPLKIEENTGENHNISRVVNLSKSTMADAYHGCAKGTAYIKNNELVAFHYGYDQPTNIPENCMQLHVEFSCYQICIN